MEDIKMKEALGMIETRGLTASIEAAERLVKGSARSMGVTVEE